VASTSASPDPKVRVDVLFYNNHPASCCLDFPPFIKIKGVILNLLGRSYFIKKTPDLKEKKVI